MNTEVGERVGDYRPQRTFTSSCTAVYLRLRLSFEHAPEHELAHGTLRQYLQQSLTQAFGKIGGAIPFEVLSLQQGGAIAFLKADTRDLAKLRAACTLITSCEGRGCEPLPGLSGTGQPYLCSTASIPKAVKPSATVSGQRSPGVPSSYAPSPPMSLLSGPSGISRSPARAAPDSVQTASDLEEGALLTDRQREAAPEGSLTWDGHHSKAPGLLSSGQAGPKHSAMLAKTALVIVTWFASNIGILLLNKHLLGGYGFRYPIFLTLCHMLACVVLSQVTEASGWVRHQAVRSKQQLLKVSVLASAFLLAVVLGNVSLRYIPVSFAQAIGATTPAATAVLALLLLRTTERAVTYVTLLPIMTGVVLATGFEPSYNTLGFLTAASACGARAFKAVLQGVLLADQNEKLDSMNLLRLMSPIATTLLLPAVALLEPTAPNVAWRLLLTQPGFAVLLLSNASLAYVVNFTNFQVTHYTSALTLQVLGCAKGVVATIVSVLIFQNPVTVLGIAGYAMTVAGVFAYGYSKMKVPGK